MAALTAREFRSLRTIVVIPIKPAELPPPPPQSLVRLLGDTEERTLAVVPISASPLFYKLQTFVPWHWYPMIPVAVDPLTGEMALEQGRMQRPDGRTPEPVGRVLAGAAPYRVREETVPRVGVRVVREPVRSRWISGDTHLWIARRKLAGRGEGSSGLQYDIAETSQPA